MMSSVDRSHAAFAALAVVSLVAAAPAAALEGADLPTLADGALAAMNGEDWQRADELLGEAIERFGHNQPFDLWGPQFGVIHYRKGLVEMRLGKWREAMASFETCYRDFPNPPDGRVPNPFHTRALLKWGEAAMGAGEWELAIRQFRKFAEERDRERDDFAQGVFHVSLAICHYRLGQLAEGNEQLEIAIRNRLTFPTPDSALMGGFQAMVEAALEAGNERAILDFLEKHRPRLGSGPVRGHEPLLLRLGGLALRAEMPRAALALYQLPPADEVARDALEARLEMLHGRAALRVGGELVEQARLEAALAALREAGDQGRGTDATRLAAAAVIHERAGNFRGAFAAYRLLDRRHPDSPQREEHLFHLARSASMVGDEERAVAAARRFRGEFPESVHAEDNLRILLSTLFYGGSHEAALREARDALPGLAAGSPGHELALHVTGGALFYLGRVEEAEDWLDQHAEQYPDSPLAPAGRYFQASNAARLGDWARAARLFDAYLEEFPDRAGNPFLAFALFDRANCHYAAGEDSAALERLERVVTEFPDSPVVDVAHALEGNVRQTMGDDAAAERAFRRALESAAARGNREVAAEAMWALVAALAPDESRQQEALELVERFHASEDGGGAFRAEMAVAQVPVLRRAGRGDEALERLREAIVILAGEARAEGLDVAIPAYAELFLEGRTAGDLREHFLAFEGLDPRDRVARALLRLAVIEAFEREAAATADERRREAARATVRGLFGELGREFEPAELSPAVLLRLAEHLRLRTAEAAASLPYYEELLARGGHGLRHEALLGRARVRAGEGDWRDALEDFGRVFEESEQASLRDEALYGMIQAEAALERWERVAELGLRYLEPGSGRFSRHEAEVELLLARSFDQRGLREDALGMYMQIGSSRTGFIAISAPATRRWMELSWERDRPEEPGVMSDRQAAYERGAVYLRLTSRLLPRMSPEDLALWREVEALVETYEADPATVGMPERERR